ncbi:MAG: 16S rRNA (adenine(1518)-N(6)/adenine(1519)-N(6))-dimethyltransferase RsmA [Candidatus Babeliales bacterium]
MQKKKTLRHAITLKKKYGQHFLQDHTVCHRAVAAAELNAKSSVIEIGCGDGILTRYLLQEPIERLHIFEIDPEWATYVTKHCIDDRIVMHVLSILDYDFSLFAEHHPWTLVANLPYQITFPLLYRIQQYRSFIPSGVIMIQEEVAQKLTAQSGRHYGHASLFFQHYFTWKLLDKVPPEAFIPAPKVVSRLIAFTAREHPEPIAHEPDFWRFVKYCFKQPRRTLHNNLKQSSFDSVLPSLEQTLLQKRAQQLSHQELYHLWEQLQHLRDSS